MSSKNKRMASRQSRVRERRRRGGGRGRGAAGLGATATQEIRRGGWRSAADGGESAQTAGAAQASVLNVSGAPAADGGGQTAASAITRKRSARARAPLAPLPMYAHLKSELVRIGALTALMAVALAVLTVFLG